MATFTRFSSDDIVITTEKVFTNTWSDNTNALTAATDETSSVQAVFTSPTSSGNYYIQVYNVADPDNAGGTPEVQYSISYGHKLGSGSEDINDGAGAEGYNSSRAIYSQYRSLVFGDETRDFSFNGTAPDDIFIINVDRARYKQSLRLGSLNLKIGTTNLTDDSVTNNGSAVLTNAGRQYNIVSGSSGVMSGSSLSQTDSGSYGLFYPDAGFIVLNAGAVSEDGNMSVTVTRGSDTANKNHQALLNGINAGAYFTLDTQENISSQFYFVRAKNKDFNYTTNPSFIDANGNLNFTSMVDNPVTYITTVGLYNDANELLAVAKLSQPITKDFTKEALIKVKLDY